jgi:hypothetical protein
LEKKEEKRYNYFPLEQAEQNRTRKVKLTFEARTLSHAYHIEHQQMETTKIVEIDYYRTQLLKDQTDVLWFGHIWRTAWQTWNAFKNSCPNEPGRP